MNKRKQQKNEDERTDEGKKVMIRTVNKVSEMKTKEQKVNEKASGKRQTTMRTKKDKQVKVK